MMAFVLLIQMFGVTRFFFLLYPGREKKPQSKQSNDAIKRARWFRSQNDRSQQRGEVMSFLDGLTTPLLPDSIVPRAQKIHQTCYLFIYV